MRLQEIGPSLEVWKLTDRIKQRAADSFPTVLGTLDALHVATALEIGQAGRLSEMILFSFDRQMNLCASALGFQVPLLHYQK